MGMYDSVLFHCPNCNEIVEVQSKAGDCVLSSIPGSRVPQEIALSLLEDSGVYCESCDAHLTIQKKVELVPVTVALELVKSW